MNKKIVAITACAAGIAHTYMAAESIKKAAKKHGYIANVETQGSIGAEDVLQENDIADADVVIIAADIDIDLSRFSGKRVYKAKSVDAVKDAYGLIKRAYDEASVYAQKGAKVGNVTLGKTNSSFIKHIMSGISYMVPMVIAAGLILAIANVFAFQKDELGRIVNWGFDNTTFIGMFMGKMFAVGQVGFKLMIPLFAGFVANSIADKPAIAPAMIGAYLANDPEFLGTETGGGFIAAIIVAFIVGYMVKGLKKIKWPNVIKTLVPIMIIPLVGTFVISVIVLFVIGQPIASMMDWLYETLTMLNTTYASAPFIVGAIIGAMVGFDFGGPVNKTALIFGTAVFTDTVAKYGVQNANFVPQTATQAAISVAPLGIWLASVMYKNKFSKSEKISATSAFGMGMVGVTEGAIPFVAADPIRLIIASVAGSALAGGLVGLFGVKFYGGIGSPLGALIGYIEQPIPFITWIGSIAAGVLLTAVIFGTLKKPVSEEIEEDYMDDEELEMESNTTSNKKLEESIASSVSNVHSDVFKETHIYVDENSKTQEEAFNYIAEVAYNHGFIESKEEYLKGLKERELESTTGFSDGIAIPHCKNKTVNKSGVFLMKFKNPIEWNSLDGSKIKVAFGLTIPEDGSSKHIKILSSIATKLIDDDFRSNIVNEEDNKKLYDLVSTIEF